MVNKIILGNRKIYKCCICHHKIERNNRLVHQIYDGKEIYGKFENENNYDFCDRCFEIFEKWINKHKKILRGDSNE